MPAHPGASVVWCSPGGITATSLGLATATAPLGCFRKSATRWAACSATRTSWAWPDSSFPIVPKRSQTGRDVVLDRDEILRPGEF
jgi:hypothetical protein